MPFLLGQAWFIEVELEGGEDRGEGEGEGVGVAAVDQAAGTEV